MRVHTVTTVSDVSWDSPGHSQPPGEHGHAAVHRVPLPQSQGRPGPAHACLHRHARGAGEGAAAAPGTPGTGPLPHLPPRHRRDRAAAWWHLGAALAVSFTALCVCVGGGGLRMWGGVCVWGGGRGRGV